MENVEESPTHTYKSREKNKLSLCLFVESQMKEAKRSKRHMKAKICVPIGCRITYGWEPNEPGGGNRIGWFRKESGRIGREPRRGTYL